MRGGDYYGVQNTNGIRFGNAVCNIGAFCGFVYKIAFKKRGGENQTYKQTVMGEYTV